jgi:hypothetical protein
VRSEWGPGVPDCSKKVYPIYASVCRKQAKNRKDGEEISVKSTLCIVLLVLLVATVCQAQKPEKATVEGWVNDQAGQPLVGVTVKFSSSLGTHQGITDKQGKYSVIVACTEQSRHTVTPSKAGYIFDPATRPWAKYSGGPSFTGRKQGEPQQKPGTGSGNYGRKG